MLTHVPNASQSKRTYTAVSNAHLHLPKLGLSASPSLNRCSFEESSLLAALLAALLADLLAALLAAPSLFLAYSNSVIIGCSNKRSLKTALSLTQS
jgi:hypothetical protein